MAREVSAVIALLDADLDGCLHLLMPLMQSWTKKVVSKDDWEKKLAAVKVYKEDMNKLVMDFLVTEVRSQQTRGHYTTTQCQECFVKIDLGTQSL